MKLLKHPLSLSFAFLLICFGFELHGQQGNADSVIYYLNKSKIQNGIDTAVFEKALSILKNSKIDEAALNKIDVSAKTFNKGNNEDNYYVIKDAMLIGIAKYDMYRAIEEGKKSIEELGKTNTPHLSLIRANMLAQMRLPYRNSDKINEGFIYFTDWLREFKLRNDSIGITTCYYVLGGFYKTIGLYDQAIYNFKKSISYLNKNGHSEKEFFGFEIITGTERWTNNTGVIGQFYFESGNYSEAIHYLYDAYYNRLKTGGLNNLSYLAVNIAQTKIRLNDFDSISYFLNQAIEGIEKEASDRYHVKVYVTQVLADYQIRTGNLDSAAILLNQCKDMIAKHQVPPNSTSGSICPDYYFALIKIKQKKYDEAIAFLKSDIAWLNNLRTDILRDYKLLAQVYKLKGDAEKANETFEQYVALQDSVLADEKKYRTMSFEVEQQMDANEDAIMNLKNENKVAAISRNYSIGIAVLLFLLAGGIYARFRMKSKTALLLQRKTNQLEQTMKELHASQQQLVQQEKLASLGALTAGIAHEIKNPLNFVNNFADLSNELIDEFLVADSEDERKEIAVDLKNNLSKITQHGKRADSIVKNMLEHSRSGNSEKQLTDINAICEEYLNLAYHGMRAANQDFNCAFEFIGDKNLPAVNCVPQDISRVVLNLINNAFYAVNEKRIKAVAANQIFEPHVTVTTHHNNNQIQIEVTDNGNGMSETVKSKLFQPFFTTKPSGKGTGLGLSLSYDIIKAHGGEIKVESTENVSTKFIISLPL